MSHSIQTYFPRQSPRGKRIESPNSDTIEDEGPAKADESSPRTWRPSTEYQEMNISDLNPGPGHIKVTGRIANFFQMPNSSKSEVAAKGSFRVIIKDDTGIFTVRTLKHRHHLLLMPGLCSGQALVLKGDLHTSHRPLGHSLAPSHLCM